MGKNDLMYRCPLFSNCSAPRCPLDLHMQDRTYFVGDAVCNLSKNKRLKIGGSLPWKGLTKKEIAGKHVWDSRDLSSREKTLQKLAFKEHKKVL